MSGDRDVICNYDTDCKQFQRSLIMGFIGDFFAKIGTATLIKIGTPIIILILCLIKTKKYGSAFDALLLGLGSTLSLFFIKKLGKSIGKILEWFLIQAFINLIIFPVLAFIYGMTRDNKQTFGKIIMQIKDLFYQWLDIIKLKKRQQS